MINRFQLFNLCLFLSVLCFILLAILSVSEKRNKRLRYSVSNEHFDYEMNMVKIAFKDEETLMEQPRYDPDSVPTFTEEQLKEYTKNFPDKHSTQHDNLDPFMFTTEGAQDLIDEKKMFKKALSKCKYCNKFPTNQTEIDLQKMDDIPEMCNGRIDAVWIWVNGSDPTWCSNLNRYAHTIDFTRYRDSRVLKYSVRSVSKYLPYIKNHFLVTADQVPDFIESPCNLTHFRITKNDMTLEVIPHSDLISDAILPTFNSEAIETYCSKSQTYDFFFYRPTPPTFYAKEDKLVIHTEQKMPVDSKPFANNQFWSCMFHSNSLINTYFEKDPNHSNMSKWQGGTAQIGRSCMATMSCQKDLVNVEQDNKSTFLSMRDDHTWNVMQKIIANETQPYAIGVNDEMNEKNFEKEMRYIHRWFENKYNDKTVFEK
ncbi:hypothetical protein EIN_201180 [Entamoeba invadens IP1]|uniref:Uncharacterized protein n=1 Tax=Entamoeba invadens IP1 TaxID=370355 RepID=A0A0A1U5N2_ENTIV|nr:hypothetical protein EIN_201180 [Entamoeba invadens IP1]ELP89623.1 hypothetical protein EIN_201180 [Entamoeba invadens IP1]|eukprot:XP_004256394.1 hypothetical protein EIN_201180 [Entamoeba invadens IP1]